MKNARFVIQIAVLMVIAFASLAAADSREELIAKYIKLSGVENALDSFPDQIEALSTQRLMTSKTPETDKKSTELLKESFDERRVKKELITFISSKMDDALLQSLLKWYESPLAQKVVDEESKSSGADKQANLLRYLAGLQENPPAQDRITLIQEVEASTQLSELTTNITIEVMKGMFKTINLSLPKEKQVELADIEKDISDTKPLLKEEFRKQMILSSFYSYRNLSNDELKEYIAFYKTEAGQKEIEITGSALSHVLNLWFATAADKIFAYAKAESEKCKE